ncbi:DNA methyltransferase [Streptomyces sp. HPF1205]|uniref:DNA-methyltransferase n=1 Tax=Streptomyces sp. HPF1205 TaxID=2873262 RepID=UPI001CEC66B2|nr:DNA methyltransferase [Streptomyces sp. HPF1205]
MRLPSGLLHYTTPLGAQYSGDSRLLLQELPADSVDLFMTSPPFPLLRPKEYGNPNQNTYVDWLLAFLQPAHRALKPAQRACRAHRIRPHPARYPPGLPEFFITLCTTPGDLVVYFFSGSNTTGQAAETLGRRWIAIDLDPHYAAASALRFPHADTRPPHPLPRPLRSPPHGVAHHHRQRRGRQAPPPLA